MGRFLHEHFLLFAAIASCAWACLLLPYHIRVQQCDMVEWKAKLSKGRHGVCWGKSNVGYYIDLTLTRSQPVILATIFVALKIRNRRLWVRLHPVYNAPDGLSDVLDRLERNAQTEVPTRIEATQLDEIDG